MLTTPLCKETLLKWIIYSNCGHKWKLNTEIHCTGPASLVPLQNQRTQWETPGNCNRGRRTFGVGKLRVTKQTQASPCAKDWVSLEGAPWTQRRVVLSTPRSPALQRLAKLRSQRAAATAQLQHKFSSLKAFLDGFINLAVVSSEEITAVKYLIKGFSECSQA